MSVVSKLSCMLIALILLSVVIPDARAGDGIFGRIRNRICKSNCSPCPPVPSCEQNCCAKYLERLQICEKLRCHIPDDLYRTLKCNAWKSYQVCLQECRCGRTSFPSVARTMYHEKHMRPGTVTDCVLECETTKRYCLLNGTSPSECEENYWMDIALCLPI